MQNTPRSKLLGRARELRREQTGAEHTLWMSLRNRALMGRKFRRQHPIGRFIADFCCPDKQLIVEVDGPTHEGREQLDRVREQWLIRRGYRILRVTNADVLLNLESVLKTIFDALAETPHPNPLPEERGEGTELNSHHRGGSQPCA